MGVIILNAVLKKLKLKDQNPILIINHPKEYEEIMTDIETPVHSDIKAKYEWIQAFVKNLEEANKIAKPVLEALEGDGYLWICYPKGSSQKYKSDCKRTTILEVCAPYNFEGVTQVSIDDDW